MRARLVRQLLYGGYAAAFSALSLGILIYHGTRPGRAIFKEQLVWAIALGLAAAVVAWVFRLGDLDGEWGVIGSLYSGLKTAAVAVAIVSVAMLAAARAMPRLVTLGFLVLAPVAVLVVRLPFVPLKRSIARNRVVVVGTEDEVAELAGQLDSRPGDYEIVAHVNGFIGQDRASELGPWVEVSETRLAEVARDLTADVIVVSPAKLDDFSLLEKTSEAHATGVKVRTFQDFYEERFEKVPLSGINEAWFLFDTGELHRPTYLRAKRVMDVMGGAVGFVAMALLFPFVAAATKLSGRGPVFYSQERVGQGGKVFRLVKFRTMGVDAEPDGPVWASAGDDRATLVGRFLRRTRIDELPQSINVLKGDMSLVGPRPERPEFVARLEELIPFYSRRHLIRPGLTGWAQVAYQYGSSVEHAMEKLQFEFYYMKNQSILLDLRILAHTARVVVSLSGV